MNYYNQLVREIGKSRAANPRRTVVMDYGSHKVIAKGASVKKLARKNKAASSNDKLSIVFQRPKENATWILARI